MRVLLDTNIIIHREAARVVNRDIGVLFRWLDNLHYDKCVHPLSVAEIGKHNDQRTREAFQAKIASYNVLQAPAPLDPKVISVTQPLDATDNDRNDTLLLNQVFCDRADLMITEDKGIHRKSLLLGIGHRVFKIEGFLEKVAAENPGLVDYKVLSVKKELVGRINLADDFFDSFREDYPGFNTWFNRKSEESAYICSAEDGIDAFLYLKPEGEDEVYSDIFPPFPRGKRLKIGTLKVSLNGYRLGERFVKIVFDNALRLGVDEVYVTIFDGRPEQLRLIDLLTEFGFVYHGVKNNNGRDELVYVRNVTPCFNHTHPRLTYPFFSRGARVFLAPIYPKYHTSLFPDSILNNESPLNFVEHEPFRNAISKVYISRSLNRNVASGDVIVFYRTGGYHASVISTVGIVESVVHEIGSAEQFLQECRRRSVFSDDELMEHWNYKPWTRPFVVNFLYAYSFPKRLNMAKLIEMGVIADVTAAPRGFEQITTEQFNSILKETQTNGRIVVD